MVFYAYTGMEVKINSPVYTLPGSSQSGPPTLINFAGNRLIWRWISQSERIQILEPELASNVNTTNVTSLIQINKVALLERWSFDGVVSGCRFHTFYITAYDSTVHFAH